MTDDILDTWIADSERAGDFDSHAVAMLARHGRVTGRVALRAARQFREVAEAIRSPSRLGLDPGSVTDLRDVARRMVAGWEAANQ